MATLRYYTGMKNKIYFFYPKGKKLTGQEMASKLILEVLGWRIEGLGSEGLKPSALSLIPKLIPVLDRDGSWLTSRLFYLGGILKLWLQFFILLFVAKPVLYLNICQTWNAVVREGILFLLLSAIRPNTRSVISLHGQNFCMWPVGSKLQRIFKTILNRADVITVLGPNQREVLIRWGLNPDKVRIVNNTCEINAKTQGRKAKSISVDSCTSVAKRINLLFLSNLIETKGYREYLEALELLSKETSVASAPLRGINAVFCGKLTDTCSSEVENDAESWILNKIVSINKSSFVSVEWVKGAYGDEKQILFSAADIFVFPTRYATEAQPIVLIEAMASGCAIITSQAGEIPSMVNDSCAIALAEATSENVAVAIKNIISTQRREDSKVSLFQGKNSELFNDNKVHEAHLDPVKKERTLEELQSSARIHFTKHFSQDIYKQQWLDIFTGLTK